MSLRVRLRPRNRRAAAFLYGAAHAMDMSGALLRNRGRFDAGFGGDARALHQDWQNAIDHEVPAAEVVSSDDGKW
jgi:hypothetical protein